MPVIWMPDAELRALQNVLTHNDTVDWEAYDRAKQYLLKPQEATDASLDAPSDASPIESPPA